MSAGGTGVLCSAVGISYSYKPTAVGQSTALLYFFVLYQVILFFGALVVLVGIRATYSSSSALKLLYIVVCGIGMTRSNMYVDVRWRKCTLLVNKPHLCELICLPTAVVRALTLG